METKMFNLFKNEDGATAIEYGLIAALISVVCIVAMQFVGDNLNNTYSSIGSALNSANN